MIGVARRILEAMLADVSLKYLTDEVLTTLMAEVSAIINESSWITDIFLFYVLFQCFSLTNSLVISGILEYQGRSVPSRY